MGSFWSQPIRVECTDRLQLITCRTINSALWFVNNKKLEDMLLGYLAKYAEKYGVLLFAFAIVGNHYHMVARFPLGQRSHFFRDFNARVAEAVRHCVPNYLGGPLFERRFTPQVLALDTDAENYFFYCALQAVSSGLCEKVSEYADYNSFQDAANDRVRVYKLFSFGKYNAARRSNPNVDPRDFETQHQLKYQRLPGYEVLRRSNYKAMLLQKLEQRRQEIIRDRTVRKKGFFGRENLLKVVPGSYPKNSKKGGMRPLVLTTCQEAKRQFLKWYFNIVSEFKEAAMQYRQGFFGTVFPQGTFRPPGLCVNCR